MYTRFKGRILWSRTWESPRETEAFADTLKKIILIQKHARGLIARRLRKQLLIAKELYVTEENYVKALGIVVDIFCMPLLARYDECEKKGIRLLQRRSDIGAIFSVIDKLYVNHRAFLSVLQERVRDWEVFAKRCVGDIFIRHTAFFDLYEVYINNYEVSMATLGRCKEEPLFTQFIHEVRPHTSSKTLPHGLAHCPSFN